ncbi:hypothetical protein CLOP_g4948 [Closterium sp. NIES-67]|nr:hypothetical protein CLOP_g4948 [Closterium sp. NIES-67]
MARSWMVGGTAVAALASVLAACATALHASGGEMGLHPMPRIFPFLCSCEDEHGVLDEGIARCQLASDFLIALAYFSIPLELVYFFLRSKVFPHRWVLLQFGLFIVLCGMTHVVNMWTYGPHPSAVAVLQTVLKVLCAAVSCATAFLLVTIIPALLNVKVRELFLQHKAAQLDREMDVMRRKEEVGRHVRMLTYEIRQSLDRHTILNTTLVELAQALCLENCTIWMPDASGSFLELTHELERRLVQAPVLVPVTDPTVQSLIHTPRALRISQSSFIGRASAPRGAHSTSLAAVRLPILPLEAMADAAAAAASAAAAAAASGGGGGAGVGGEDVNGGGDERSGLVAGGGGWGGLGGGGGEEGGSGVVDGEERIAGVVPLYGLMVLVLHGDARRQWKAHEVEMVEVVADQVAVALSHAAVVEETQRRRDELEEQNRTLQTARQRAEVAVMARNDFLAVMNHEMRTPLHSITALASILNEEDLSHEQAPMVATVLRSASLLTSLITDVLDLSRQEESLHLEKRPFDLRKLCREAGKLAWPLVRSKDLQFTLEVSGVVPRYVVGDEKRLLRLMLHLIGRAVKKTDEGFVSVRVSVGDGRTHPPHSSQSSSTAGDTPSGGYIPAAAAAAAAAGDNSLGLKPHTPWELLLGQDLVNIRVDIKDSGRGLTAMEFKQHQALLQQQQKDEEGEGDGRREAGGNDGVREGGQAKAAQGVGEERRGGTMLGFEICQKFVQLMGGYIWIESGGEGLGATVTFVVRLVLDRTKRQNVGFRERRGGGRGVGVRRRRSRRGRIDGVAGGVGRSNGVLWNSEYDGAEGVEGEESEGERGRRGVKEYPFMDDDEDEDEDDDDDDDDDDEEEDDEDSLCSDSTVSSMDCYVQELEGVHVLLVEDNVANRIATHQMLLTLRCHVSSVGSAQECQMELTTRKSPTVPPVDVVLLDVCMPDVDGFEVARRIHNLFRPDERPLIVGLTARTDSGMAEACVAAGMDAVLLKPVTVRQLAATLCHVLNGV